MTDNNNLLNKACTECTMCGKCNRYRNIKGIMEGITCEFNKNPITGNKECYGMAVDIGTTTIAAYLFKLPQGECVKAVCVQNMQSIYGTDVILRLEYSNKGGFNKLHKIIQEQINSIKKEFKKEVDIIVLAANTIMLHFFTGINPKGIENYPFKPQSLFGEWFENIYILPCISSYIGADITAGIIATNMLNDKTSILIDIGTNCEIVLWHNNKLTCCSAAAGPAFEGFGISMGMPSSPGAINKVSLKDNVITYSTIDNKPATGVCGTGLIDAMACILRLGIPDETGYIEEPFEIGNSKVYITAKDIRQIQLAKSAVRSGVDTLIEECGIAYHDVDKLYLAGSFGSLIDINNSTQIGLINPHLTHKAIAAGNTSVMGASMVLQNKNYAEELKKQIKTAKIIELANNKTFKESFIKNINF